MITASKARELTQTAVAWYWGPSYLKAKREINKKIRKEASRGGSSISYYINDSNVYEMLEKELKESGFKVSSDDKEMLIQW